ncbi:MAG: protein kinase domain-containing protein [Bacillota bacterium]
MKLIGEGGMALVYRGECSLLHRDVAIKVLRPQYATDHDFVERFRREAQAAASLSHPNVVNIYDVGKDNGVDFIVMEHIYGRNLKEIIRMEGPLPIPQAVQISRQICEALLHAHQHQIIHRDIKSQNILVADESLVKVTDFGIARALSDAGLTQTGSVLGSAQYISPEQAKGAEVGEQSDLYSLGCVMYEMLTGHLPFTGETAIALALKHIQDPPPPPGQFRKNIPAALEHVVLKALQKDLNERYHSAREMLRDIAAVQRSLETVPDAAQDGPTQILSPMEVTKELWLHKAAAWFWITAGIAVVLMFAYFLAVYFYPPPSVKVPNLVGKTLEEARRLARDKGLHVQLGQLLYSDVYPENCIIHQKPAAGSFMRKSQPVKVDLSKGNSMVRMPDLTGLEENLARMKLEELGLEIGSLVQIPTDEVAPGIVLEQNPAAAQMIPQNTRIILSVSVPIDNNQLEMPNVYGLTLQEAENTLRELGLVLGQIKYQFSSSNPEGIILNQDPSAGTLVSPGTAVNLTVSSH